MYKIEYLVIVSNRNTNSFRSLKNLLLSDDDVQAVTKDKIKVNNFEFQYTFETGKINADSKPTYFGLQFICEREEDITKFIACTRIIRGILSIVNTTIYKLWDDVALYYASKGYSRIFYVENLMRKLMTKFMYINLGINWKADRTPEEVIQSVKNNKNDPNFLHNVDFIQLSKFLFSENFPTHKESLIKKLSKTLKIEDLDLNEIKSLLPESNWSRYFEDLVNCESEFLIKRWERLYSLRNQIAHNSFISIGELNEIEELVDEISPILEEAIDKLTTIIVPEDEIENIVENVASERNQQLGSFIHDFKSFEETLSKIHQQITTSNNSIQNKFVPIRKALETISNANLISQDIIDSIKSVNSFRNTAIHNSNFKIDPLLIKMQHNSLIELTEKLSNEIEVNEAYHTNRIKDEQIIRDYKVLKRFILELENVTVKYNKHYISYKTNRNIVDIKLQQKSIKLWLNLPKGSLDDPLNMAKDVSEIGHQGNGDYEVLIKSEEDLEKVFPLISQAYHYHNEK